MKWHTNSEQRPKTKEGEQPEHLYLHLSGLREGVDGGLRSCRSCSLHNNLAVVRDLLAYVDICNTVARAKVPEPPLGSGSCRLSEGLVTLALFDLAISIHKKKMVAYDCVGEDSPAKRPRLNSRDLARLLLEDMGSSNTCETLNRGRLPWGQPGRLATAGRLQYSGNTYGRNRCDQRPCRSRGCSRKRNSGDSGALAWQQRVVVPSSWWRDTRSTVTSRRCWLSVATRKRQWRWPGLASLLVGLAGLAAGPRSQCIELYGQKYNVVGAAVNVVRFGNNFTRGVFSAIGTIFRDWSWNFPTSNFKDHPSKHRGLCINLLFIFGYTYLDIVGNWYAEMPISWNSSDEIES